jgi:hypothetical protein
MRSRVIVTALLAVAVGRASGGFQEIGQPRPAHLRAIRKLSPPQKTAFYKRHQIVFGEVGDLTLTAANPLDSASGYYLEGDKVFWSPKDGIDMSADSTATVSVTPTGITNMLVLTFSNNWVGVYPCTATAYGPYSVSKHTNPLLTTTTGRIGSGVPPFAVVAPKRTAYVEFKITPKGAHLAGYTTGFNAVTISSVGG